MKIEDILKKQGELYKNLHSNNIIQTYNKTIEKPKPPKLVPYKEFLISGQEYDAITGLEKLINKEPVIVGGPLYNSFEISIDNNRITYLSIINLGLTNIPKEISCLTNLQILWLSSNQIQKLENLDNLTNLQELYLYNNQIQKLENLNNLPNLQRLWLQDNQIQKLKNLDKLQNLQELEISGNPIKNKEEIEKLREKGIEVSI